MYTGQIKWLVMDVDGTLTDGKIYIGPDGEIMKAFNVKDGYAITHILPLLKIEPIIITGRESSIVTHRCRELGVTSLYQNVEIKLNLLKKVIDESKGKLAEVIYIGDDINDLECMQAIKDAGGIVACPSDAAKAVCLCSDYVASAAGGAGAVRETVEWLERQFRFQA